MVDSDYLLVYRMKRGNEEAIEEFVKKYYSDIYKYCYRKLENKTQAEDVVQETFGNFFAAFDKYTHMGKTKNYLYVIAGNLCKNIYKSKVCEPLDNIEKELVCDDCYEKIDSNISINEALKFIPEEQREVLLLHYYQDLKLREIAEVLGIKLSLVKYRLKQGVEGLEKILDKEEFNYGK